LRNTLKNNEQKNTNANTLRQGNTKRKASAIHPTTDFIGRGFLARCYNNYFNTNTYVLKDLDFIYYFRNIQFI
ncbi:MAG: hypothetical protein IJV29_18450, partial [Butyrivibrio sp.]|nr:hypothetical protein [Butyrivibrio sp.]